MGQEFKRVTKAKRDILSTQLHDIKVTNRFEGLNKLFESSTSSLPQISPPQSQMQGRRPESTPPEPLPARGVGYQPEPEYRFAAMPRSQSELGVASSVRTGSQ